MLESKRRAIIFLTISLLLAVGAGFFVLKKVSELNAELGGMAKIYVAASDIPSRTLIEPKQVTTMEIPKKFVKDGSHVTDVKDLINKVLVVPLEEGDIITQEMIKQVSTTANEKNRLVVIPQNDRIRFDQPLEDMDRVDIVVSHNLEGKPVTETFMKDVLVSKISGKKESLNAILVEVSLEDAPRIIHMENYADSIRILKANVGKNEQPKPEQPKAEPAKEPAPAEAKPAEAKPAEKKPAEQPPAEQKPADQQKK